MIMQDSNKGTLIKKRRPFKKINPVFSFAKSADDSCMFIDDFLVFVTFEISPIRRFREAMIIKVLIEPERTLSDMIQTIPIIEHCKPRLFEKVSCERKIYAIPYTRDNNGIAVRSVKISVSCLPKALATTNFIDVRTPETMQELLIMEERRRDMILRMKEKEELARFFTQTTPRISFLMESLTARDFDMHLFWIWRPNPEALVTLMFDEIVSFIRSLLRGETEEMIYQKYIKWPIFSQVVDPTNMREAIIVRIEILGRMVMSYHTPFFRNMFDNLTRMANDVMSSGIPFIQSFIDVIEIDHGSVQIDDIEQPGESLDLITSGRPEFL
jgi:hypothetical protein